MKIVIIYLFILVLSLLLIGCSKEIKSNYNNLNTNSQDNHQDNKTVSKGQYYFLNGVAKLMDEKTARKS